MKTILTSIENSYGNAILKIVDYLIVICDYLNVYIYSECQC